MDQIRMSRLPGPTDRQRRCPICGLKGEVSRQLGRYAISNGIHVAGAKKHRAGRAVSFSHFRMFMYDRQISSRHAITS